MGIQCKVPAGELIMSSLSECDKPAAEPLRKAGDGSPGAAAEGAGPGPAGSRKSGAPALSRPGAHGESGSLLVLLVNGFCLEP